MFSYLCYNPSLVISERKYAFLTGSEADVTVIEQQQQKKKKTLLEKLFSVSEFDLNRCFSLSLFNSNVVVEKKIKINEKIKQLCPDVFT